MTTMFKDGLLAGKRILVTGGGTGLGREMAEDYLRLGATVHICGRRKGVLDDTAKELMDRHGGQVHTHSVDIRVAQAVDEMIAEIFAMGTTHRPRQQCGRQFHQPDQGSLAARIRRHRGDRLPRLVLRDARLRQALDRGRPQGLRHLHPDHLGVERRTLHRAVGHVEGGHQRHDPVARRRMGRYGIRLNAIAPGPFPTKGAWERLNPGSPPSRTRAARAAPWAATARCTN